MLKDKLIQTNNLNEAAFFTALGGGLTTIEGKYPENVFNILANPLLLWWEKYVGLVPYKKYANQRIRLKEKGRKKAGLPAHFVGKNKGFTLGEVARVVPWKNKEVDKDE